MPLPETTEGAPALGLQRVEGFYEFAGIRVLSLAQRLEPIGDLRKTFLTGGFGNPRTISPSVTSCAHYQMAV